MVEKTFLWSMHYFRAFAIINIVIVHLWRIPIETNEEIGIQEIIREVLFHNSTIYFIFISGFLFIYLKNKFQLDKFYINKLRFIISPYLFNIITFWIIFYYLDLLGLYSYQSIKTNLVSSIFNGSVTPHLWYIPFITLIFLTTPIFIFKPQILNNKFLPVLFLLPLLGTRTGTEITIGQYIYFYPIYILGIFVAMNFKIVLIRLNKYKALLFSIVVISSIILFITYIIYQNGEISQIQNSLYYIQKLAIIGIILPSLEKITTNSYKILDQIASMSFAIYFIHYTLGRLQQPFLFKYLNNYIPPEFWGAMTFLFPFLIIIECIIIIKAIKKILGFKSKYIIGY